MWCAITCRCSDGTWGRGLKKRYIPGKKCSYSQQQQKNNNKRVELVFLGKWNVWDCFRPVLNGKLTYLLLLSQSQLQGSDTVHVHSLTWLTQTGGMNGMKPSLMFLWSQNVCTVSEPVKGLHTPIHTLKYTQVNEKACPDLIGRLKINQYIKDLIMVCHSFN